MATIPEALAVALQYHRAGNLQQAEAIYRQILHADPNQADALHLLGEAAVQTGRFELAVQYISRAIGIRPADPAFHYNLGKALQGQGKWMEAMAQYQETIRLKPDDALAHNNLGNTLMEQGRLAEAVTQYQEAIRLKPDYALAHNNLGNVLMEQSRLAEAVVQYQEALRLKPDLAGARNNLGEVYRAQGQVAEAVAQYQEALRLKPDYAEAHNHLGAAYRALGDFDTAIAHLQESLRLNPNLGQAYYSLGQLAASGRYRFSNDDIHAIRNLLAERRLPSQEQCLLHFTLADNLDQRDCCDEAFEHYRQGNDLRRQYLQQRGQAFDPGRAVNLVEQLVAAFDSAYFIRVQSFGLDTELPVFIVGVPRSGTTLVEQILCSHPHVFGAGELLDIPQIVDELPEKIQRSQPYPVCMAGIDHPVVQTMAERYVGHLAQLGGTASRVIDKLPDNYRHLGFISTMFPKARLIHCRRDPLDTCLSCYCQHFRYLNFTNSLEDIALTYQLYRKTMAHWHAVLPKPIFEVQYEGLVENQEAVSRKMIAFCGLAWDDRCLAFHKTRRAVQTASSVQVRQPLYRTSIGRWKRYQAHLGPLIEALRNDGANE